MNETANATLAIFADTIGRLVAHQPDAVNAAAALIADTVGTGGVVHVHDTGHMVGHELVSRTGGFVAFSRLEYEARVSSGGIAREGTASVSAEQAAASTAQLVHWVLDQNSIRAGDVLVLSSVSGTSAAVVELASQAIGRGIPVIALTSVAFSAHLQPKHASGRRLLDTATVVLDNLAPYGDSAQTVEGLPRKVVPISGVAGAALLWAVVAEATALLVARGIEPSVYPSINLPDGPTQVAAIEARYRETGR
ncbi:MAG TPA: sugar isomerase domain-containing protein [Propionicimonas sp.]|jgi:uncharacterized phosphosugar-binding protein